MINQPNNNSSTHTHTEGHILINNDEILKIIFVVTNKILS